MKPSLKILRGELERLFSTTALDSICKTYLDIDPEELGIQSDNKATYARQLVDYCDAHKQSEALADAITMEKPGMTDPRMKHVYTAGAAQTVNRSEVEGFQVKDKIDSDDVYAMYNCEVEGGEADGAYVMMVINSEHAVNRSAVERFILTCRVLGSMDVDFSPEFKKIARFSDGRPYIIMKQPQGERLKDMDGVSPENALNLFDAILSVIEKLEEKSLLFGDVRASNIWVRDGEVPALTCLGIGFDKLMESAGWVKGASMVHNIAPEVLRGQTPGVASDLYSLGCVLFELLTGKTAFAGRKAVDIAAGHIIASPESLADNYDGVLPEKLKELVEGLMQRDVSARIKDTDAARKKLDEARLDLDEAQAHEMQEGTRADIEEELDALAEDAGNDSLLELLLQAVAEKKAAGAAADALNELGDSASDPQIAFKLILTAAELAQNKSRDFEKAAELYDKLAAADPANVDVFNGRLDAYRKQNNHQAVIELLGMKAEAAETQDDKSAALMEIAQIFEMEMGEPGKAFDYYTACISGNENDKKILSSLEKIAIAENRVEELVQTVGNAASAVESAGNKELTLYFYRKLGSWYNNQLQQPAVAMQCYTKVLQLEPTDDDAYEAVATAYRSAQQWMELSQVINQRMEAETIPEVKRALQCEAARVYYERMGELEGAKGILDNVLKDDPGSTAAMDLLRQIYVATEDYASLAAILSEAIEKMAQGSERVEERYQLGEIYEVRLQDIKSAEKQYKKAVDEDAGHLDSLKGLERLYAMNEDFGGLKDVLEKQLDVADTPKQKVGLLLRLANILEEEFKDAEKTIETYKSIIEIDTENADALLALTRLLRKDKQFESLVDVFDKRIAALEEGDSGFEVKKDRAVVVKDELKDEEKSIEAYNELAEICTDSGQLERIIRVQIELGQLEAADAAYLRVLEMTTEKEARVNILVELAAFRVEKLKNVEAAEQVLNEAKELAPENAGVIAELAEVLAAKGDFAGALEMLAARIELAEGSNARGKIYAQMGAICFDKIEDEEKATSYFENALGCDTSNMVASDKLATIYRKNERWDDAIEIYNRWIPSAGTLSEESRLELFNNAATVYDKVGRAEKALELYKKASELDDNPGLKKQLAEVALDREEWQLAEEQFSLYVKAMGKELDNDEKVDLFIKRGKAMVGCKDYDAAAKMARQATVMAADNLDARLLLADIHEARQDYRGAVEARTKVLASMDKDDEARVEIVRQTANLMFDKLKNADGAARLLNEALELAPDNRDLLGELLKMFSAARKFKEVINVVLKLAEHVKDDLQLSKQYLAVAKIYRRELKDLKNAAVYFSKVLEHDSANEDAQNALIQVQTDAMDWDGLEKTYKGMIGRLSGDAEVEDRVSIFRPLADLYMTKLEGRESDAITMYEALSQMEPTNNTWKEKLTELYGWNTDYVDKSLPLHRELLNKNITRVDSFRMLYRIFSAQQSADHAWCAASMLSLLNQAAPDERKYYKDNLAEGYPPITESIDDEMWTRKFYHKDMNVDISKIFATIMPAIVSAKCTSLEQYGLDPASSVDFTTDPSSFSELANFAFGVAGIPAVHLFFNEQYSGLALTPTNPPAMIAGGDAAQMGDYLGTAFSMGQTLALLRPGLMAKMILTSGTELSSWLLAALKIFVPNLPVPNKQIGGVNERLAPIRNVLDNESNEKLQGYVQSFVGQAADVDLKKWARGVDYTGDRAGLVMCGDMGVASRKIEATVADPKEKARRIAELSKYMVSEDYFDVRSKLGISL